MKAKQCNSQGEWQCSHCQKWKPESEYYHDRRTSNGLKAQCKQCHLMGSIRTRDENLKRATNRKYMRRARMRSPQKFRDREKAAAKKRPWGTEKAARYQLNLALARGDIRKPGQCEFCGKKVQLTAHHKDYSKPLIVDWLCYECHGKEHQKSGVGN